MTETTSPSYAESLATQTSASLAHEFLWIEWRNAGMAGVATTSRARPSHAPSAKQLARGLFRGDGQWRPYAKHFEPLMPILKPWIDRYGYAED